jgi:hypothetical protein
LDFNRGLRYTHEEKTYTYMRQNPTALQDVLGVGQVYGLPSAPRTVEIQFKRNF